MDKQCKGCGKSSGFNVWCSQECWRRHNPRPGETADQDPATGRSIGEARRQARPEPAVGQTVRVRTDSWYVRGRDGKAEFGEEAVVESLEGGRMTLRHSDGKLSYGPVTALFDGRL